MKQSTEFKNFDRTMRELIKVPHEEIKKQLDAERDKKKKQKRSEKKSRNEDPTNPLA